MSKKGLYLSVFLILSCLIAELKQTHAQDYHGLTQSEVDQITLDAYVYFYPLISMEITRQVSTNHAPGTKPGMGPMNSFHHMRAFPSADFKEVIRPNFDTLYSSAWLDLTAGPMIVSSPDTNGRFFLLPMLDMWSDVFASPGKRTSGTTAAKWAITPPGWSGSLPAGVNQIKSPTTFIWIIGRTQTNGASDYENVHKIQDGYVIIPLNKKESKSHYKIDPSVDTKTPPLEQVNNMPAAKYFGLASQLMKTNPPHLTDTTILLRLARIGIKPGKTFDLSACSEQIKSSLESAPSRGLALMKNKIPTLARVVDGWQMNTDTMGVYGNYYLKRAIVAMVGLGANLPEDAIYPLNIYDSDGKQLKGENDYVLHFPKDKLPPANAFWSITMYDQTGFQVANELNRFAIGDRDALKFNSDGSLDIYIQSKSPGKDKESNWLPAPAKGKLGVTMRLYAPKQEALDGRWSPPAIKQD